MTNRPAPSTFQAIGYTRAGGLPLERISMPVPTPARGEVLIHASWSSLNPLEHKLATLNFLGRVPPVSLGFDLAGTVVALGEDVREFEIGDQVMAMADSNGMGGWAEDGGGYALARTMLTAHVAPPLSLRQAAALPTCFLSAFVALQPNLQPGDTVYIPGGGGGVGHLAIQIARVLGAASIISSAGTAASMQVARASGADVVFNYRADDIGGEISTLTKGEGVDLVFDATYSDPGYARTAGMVRRGGAWSVLGVGPGKTSRTAETATPVFDILAERGARYVNVNLLRYFAEADFLNAQGAALLNLGIRQAARWAADGRVAAHISRQVPGTAGHISAALAEMAAGRGGPGKIVVALI